MAKEELAPKVYFLTYDKPRYVSEIGEKIYGVKKETYPKIMGKKQGAIYKCLTEDWIEDVTGSIKPPKEKKPGFEKRKYYKAKVDPLIFTLKTKISLDPFDEYILRQILDSKFFRYLVGNLKIDIKEELNPITYIFMQLDYFATFYLRNGTLTAFGSAIGKKIKNQEQYETLMGELKTLFDEKEFENSMEGLRDHNPLEPILKLLETKENKQEMYTVMKDALVLFFTPKSLMEKIRGISIIGQMDQLFNVLYSESKDTDDFTKYLLSKIQSAKLDS